MVLHESIFITPIMLQIKQISHITLTGTYNPSINHETASGLYEAY
jgi:hypothetical protein